MFSSRPRDLCFRVSDDLERDELGSSDFEPSSELTTSNSLAEYESLLPRDSDEGESSLLIFLALRLKASNDASSCSSETVRTTSTLGFLQFQRSG